LGLLLSFDAPTRLDRDALPDQLGADKRVPPAIEPGHLVQVPETLVVLSEVPPVARCPAFSLYGVPRLWGSLGIALMCHTENYNLSRVREGCSPIQQGLYLRIAPQGPLVEGINRINQTGRCKKVKRDKSVRGARRAKVLRGEVLLHISAGLQRLVGRREPVVLPEIAREPGEYRVGVHPPGRDSGLGAEDRIMRLGEDGRAIFGVGEGAALGDVADALHEVGGLAGHRFLEVAPAGDVRPRCAPGAHLGGGDRLV